MTPQDYLPGSTVHYKERTMPNSQGRNGVLQEVKPGHNGTTVAVITFPDSVMETLIENVTLVRTPHPKIAPKDKPQDRML